MFSFDLRMPTTVLFGSGKINMLPKALERFGKRILFLTGQASLLSSGKYEMITDMMKDNGLTYKNIKIVCEPTVEMIDGLCSELDPKDYDVIVAVGGGSVIDAAKALRVMLFEQGSVVDYIEGIGSQRLSGQRLPLIAVPTTAGTGSETTSNAVIARYGNEPFKRSLRHIRLMPNVAVIDPELTLSCSYPVTMYSGFDAFCQLIEAYVSADATPYTDILVVEGLTKLNESFADVCTKGGDDIILREKMSYASWLSGVGLQNSSLTALHGLASSIGGLYDIPHGEICAALIFEATLMNMRRVQFFEAYSESKAKYAQIGSILSGIDYSYDKADVLLRAVSEYLQKITVKLKVPNLSQLGVKKDDFYKIVTNVRQNGNPVQLAETELTEILENSY